jgi:hypothetical protein
MKYLYIFPRVWNISLYFIGLLCFMFWTNYISIFVPHIVKKEFCHLNFHLFLGVSEHDEPESNPYLNITHRSLKILTSVSKHIYE